MENILEKTVKENGNIDLNELSWKQVVALLNAWDSSFARNENTSFSEMVKRCYKSRPWHENANIIYLHRDNKKTTILPHACYNLDEAEENVVHYSRLSTYRWAAILFKVTTKNTPKSALFP